MHSDGQSNRAIGDKKTWPKTNTGKTSTTGVESYHRKDTEEGADHTTGIAGRVSNKFKRYNLVIPHEVFNEVQKLANEKQTTVVDLFRRFIRLGLLVMYLEDRKDVEFIIREGDVEQKVILL